MSETKGIIDVQEPMEFRSTTESMFVDSTELCTIINGLFSGIFGDYAGCSIHLNSQRAAGEVGGVPVYPNPDGVVDGVPLNAHYVSLIFKDRGEMPKGADGKPLMHKNLIALRSDTKKDNSSIASRYFNYIGSYTKNRNYDVSEETKASLEDFMFHEPYRKLDKNFWSKHIVEYAENVAMGTYNSKFVSHVKIIGLSLDALVSTIFGSKDEEGNSVEYMVTQANVPTNMGNTRNQIFQIQRLDSNEFKKLMNKLYGTSPLSSTYVPVNGRA